MSEIRDDLSTIADLVHSEGTEADKRALARLRARAECGECAMLRAEVRVLVASRDRAWRELDEARAEADGLRRQLAAAREALRLGA